MSQNIPRQTILVVDDTPANIDVVKSLLSKTYLVQAAVNGMMALKIVSKKKPDLILLDIMMPEMDGYEVCARLKQNEETRDIPIIFLTAQREIESMVKGFEIGGVDYVTKPFNPSELIARLKTHLELKLAREEIETQKQQLEKQNLELIESARLREDVEQITRHDLKSPLNAIVNFPRLIMHNKNLSDADINALKIIESSGFRMLNMVNRSLDVFKMERGIYKFQPGSVNILKVLENIHADMYALFQSGNNSMKVLLSGSPVNDNEKYMVTGEDLLCYSMLANLIKNALEASPEGGCVTVSILEEEESIINIHNTGTVPEDIRDKFFDKYSTAGKNEKGTGLGTYSAKLIAETQQGSISMSTSEKEGTTISIRLLKWACNIPPADPGDIYQTKNTPEDTEPIKRNVLTPESFNGISSDVLEQLKNALLQGDYDQSTILVSIIRQHDKTLADTLMVMIDEFEFDKIIKFI